MCFKSSKHDERPPEPPGAPKTPATQPQPTAEERSKSPINNTDAAINEHILSYRDAGYTEEGLRGIVEEKLAVVYVYRYELERRNNSRDAKEFLDQINEGLNPFFRAQEGRTLEEMRSEHITKMHNLIREVVEDTSDEVLHKEGLDMVCQAAAAWKLIGGQRETGLRQLARRMYEADRAAEEAGVGAEIGS